jgi:hypothetical protein
MTSYLPNSRPKLIKAARQPSKGPICLGNLVPKLSFLRSSLGEETLMNADHVLPDFGSHVYIDH